MESMTSSTRNPIVAGNDAATASTTPTTPAVAPTPGKARVAVSFLQTGTDAELIVDSERILMAMTGNTAYPTPNPALADLTTARNSYIAAVNSAHDSKLGLSTRKEQRTNFTAMLRSLAHYVQVTSAGNRTTLLSSGFPAQRTRAPVGELLPPTGLVLVRGKLSGQLLARCRKHPQAGAYHWQIGPTATPMVWQPIVTTLAAHTSFEGLTLYTQYTAQVRVIGTAGPSNWSDVASVVVV
jgi:hypothetical protein